MFLKWRSKTYFRRGIILFARGITDSHFTGVEGNLSFKEKGLRCWLYHVMFCLCRKPSRVGRGNLWVCEARSVCICWSAWRGKAILHSLGVGLAVDITKILPSSSNINWLLSQEVKKKCKSSTAVSLNLFLYFCELILHSKIGAGVLHISSAEQWLN